MEGAKPSLQPGVNKHGASLAQAVTLVTCNYNGIRFESPEFPVTAVGLTEHFLFSWLLPSKYSVNLKLMQTSEARQGKSYLRS